MNNIINRGGISRRVNRAIITYSILDYIDCIIIREWIVSIIEGAFRHVDYIIIIENVLGHVDYIIIIKCALARVNYAVIIESDCIDHVVIVESALGRVNDNVVIERALGHIGYVVIVESALSMLFLYGALQTYWSCC